jgi:hypothetical protein
VRRHVSNSYAGCTGRIMGAAQSASWEMAWVSQLVPQIHPDRPCEAQS